MKRTKKEEDIIMAFAEKHNKSTSNVFTYQQIKDAPYIKVKDVYNNGNTSKDTALTVRGCYVNRGGRYGDSPALICEGFNVNLPNHMLQEVNDILQDPQDIADINAGRVWFYAYEYTNRNGGSSYSIRWVDLDDIVNTDALPF